MAEAVRRLEGKVALITGAATGIGLAMGRQFVTEGAYVALADLADPPDLGADRSIALRCDVTSPESAAATVDAVVERFGRLDVLINNAAARTPSHTIANLTLDDWQEALSVNLTGPFLMSRAALGVMSDQGSGAIIHVASQLGHVGAPTRAVYAATKAALISLARTMALDHGPDGIRVASLSPGAVLTGRLEVAYGSPDAASAALAGDYAAGRLGQPEEIAGAAVYLASDEAAFLTGSDLLIDGGYTAR